MALENFGALKTFIATTIGRDDLATTIIPAWVAMAEADIAREIAPQATLTALTTDSSTNWVLTSHPDVYLYGSLVHSAPLLIEDERLPVWQTMYAKALSLITKRTGDWESTDDSLATYAGLKSVIAKLLGREDVASLIPMWIDLTEADLNRQLYSRLQEAYVSFTTLGGLADLPDDFAGLRNIELDGTERELLYVSPTVFDGNLETSGTADYYTIQGDQFLFYPAPPDGTTVEIRYRQRIPALTDANTSNWVLTTHPDLYLYGTLVQAATYLGDGRLTAWAGIYQSGIRTANKSDTKEKDGAFLQSFSGYGNTY